MIWFDSIYDLGYYNQQRDIPCYCEMLVLPSDLQLTAEMPAYGSAVPTAVINLYSGDGKIFYQDVTQYFDLHFYQNSLGIAYLQIDLRDFPPEMCAHDCWILNVVVTTSRSTIPLFNKWTDRYCNSECCTPVTSITVSDDDPEAPDSTNDAPVWDTVTHCGDPIIRIESWFTCFDKFNNVDYRNGQRKITNIRGKLKRLPRQIEKEISFNCKVQRVTSVRKYFLEGWEFLPDWKMDEIEGQFLADNILINGRPLYFPGGVAFEKVENICQDIYMLRAEVQECEQRQIFGCESKCEDGAYERYYVFRGAIKGVFDENRQLIGNDLDSVVNYLRSFSPISVERMELVISPDCDVEIIKAVSASFLPSYLFFNGLLSSNKIYGQSNIDEYALCIGVKKCDGVPFVSAVVESLECVIPLFISATVQKSETGMTIWRTFSTPVFDVGYIGDAPNLDYYNLDLIGATLLQVEIGGNPVPLDSVVFDNLTGHVTLPLIEDKAIKYVSAPGNNTNTQTFPILEHKVVIEINMGGQSYGSDFFVQSGDMLWWVNGETVFTGVIVVSYVHKDMIGLPVQIIYEKLA